MACCPLDNSCSSHGSAQSDSGSEDESDYETDATDVMDASEGELDDSAWLLADNDHPPEYYIRQWQEDNDEKDKEENYSPGTSSCSTGLRSNGSSKQLVAHFDVGQAKGGREDVEPNTRVLWAHTGSSIVWCMREPLATKSMTR